ncbi:hypothetical protein CY652_04285 [Burkholderia sp. WAC0059]|uniref:DUF2939 domain-containing protein n=1 Tax=Burkholderia sp. WAC0059 TaxID=2066022 RepID=UPI000C7F3763|nr:DUF2939 domain-containing protein [Burkholderia sp. WAC0059]PLZ03613.1 hypothetical protein CY652_04285 [Burkholderia sp. WAC0059]
MTDTTVPAKNRSKPLIAALVAIVVVAILAYAYASPYLALSRIKRAADERDAATLNEYVDYPALRASLKEQIGAMLRDRLDARHDGNPLALFGAVIGAALIGPLVDVYATPEGVEALLNGMPPRGEPGEQPAAPPAPSASAASAASAPPAAGASEPPAQTTAGYRGINEFAVTYRRRENDSPYTAILVRHGLFSWKLSAVDLGN